MERHRLPRPHAPFPFISAINRLPADAIAHLPRKKDGTVNAYALGIAAQNAHRFSTEQLVAGCKPVSPPIFNWSRRSSITN